MRVFSNMTKIPKISRVTQKKLTGQTVAIVDGRIVASGKDAVDAEKKAMKKGYSDEDIMTTYIMGNKSYVL